jgi:carbamoyl-phosphate synthase small subunit
MKATLVLADGTVFRGAAVGARGERVGEVVFNTAITGYQEILTDPSYRGQIVTMTYPHIGNTGVNFEDNEAVRPYLSGFIVKEFCPLSSNWRKDNDLEDFLEKNGIMGLHEIDTRKLTRNLRETGAKKGIISTEDHDYESLLRSADFRYRGWICERGHCSEYDWDEPTWNEMPHRKPEPQFRSISAQAEYPELLVDAGKSEFPGTATADEVLAAEPDGIFLSNGPGDPQTATYAIENVKRLIGKKPVFGICLGHQILGLALGGKTFKLTFGHHGANHPVRRLETGHVEITSQNHNFAVDPESVRPECE